LIFQQWRPDQKFRIKLQFPTNLQYQRVKHIGCILAMCGQTRMFALWPIEEDGRGSTNGSFARAPDLKWFGLTQPLRDQQSREDPKFHFNLQSQVVALT
jgi:hypothetical protein